MRRPLLLLLATLLLCSCGGARYAVKADYPSPQLQYSPEGTLEECFFASTEPGMLQRRALVYLPPEYADTSRRFPVLYLLHGARGNECVWIEKGDLLQHIDSLHRAAAMLPTIVVLPNVNQYNDSADYGHARLKSALESFYEVDGTVERHFVQDVVAATDSRYRTLPDKEHRAVAGLSIGAMQAIWLSANHPDLFGYVGMFSPMVHSFIRPGRDNDFYRHLADKQRRQFADPPRLYLVMIGSADFFHPSIACWSRSLTRRGYPCEYVCYPGGHEWYNWSAFCSLFLQRLWQ